MCMLIKIKEPFYLVPETINGIVAGYKCGIVENTVNKTHIFEVNDFFYSCLGIVYHVKSEEGGEMAEEYEEDFGKTSIN